MLELWAGPECTVNRIGDRFADQLRLTGHHDRDADLDLIAQTGAKAVRYPILWERVAPEHPDKRDWSWSDRRMAGLRDRGIRPIVGLIHHGSGPRYTNLLREDFASGLARHARAAAERYPWVEAWTPVNEPCTTARFSCLYGHWYPHLRDERAFWLALLNQVDGTRLAMRQIRAINPQAQLIQTDDLGRTYATAAMREQAAFDNQRRWMGWDLLLGRVNEDHPLHDRLAAMGLRGRLEAIADDPCPPDIIGINHYLTSDRFLDHRVRRYPAELRGGNDQRAFVDTEAVRVLEPGAGGFGGALREAWERYGLPLAVTEAHNGCTREEQMRWTKAAWDDAQALRAQGIDIRAITSWALFGSQGWNTLLTARGAYEPGAYDGRADIPRPTAICSLLRSLATAGPPDHVVLQGEGWWRREARLTQGRIFRPASAREHDLTRSLRSVSALPPVLIVGATGTLGQAMGRACAERNIFHAMSGRSDLNLLDMGSIIGALEHYRPWLVINAAGWVRVDEAEDDAQTCLAVNADGAARLARACADRDVATVTFSTDLLFDGLLGRALTEDDVAAPLNVYGRSKALAEAAIRTLPGSHLVVRTAAFFSPFDSQNFAVHVVDTLSRGRRFAAVRDHVVSPTYVPSLCDAVLDLAIDGARGVRHVTHGEGLSWADFARRIARATGLDPALIDDVTGAAAGWRAKRPTNVALHSNGGKLLPSLDEAIDMFARSLRTAPLQTTSLHMNPRQDAESRPASV
ncbi:MULTISPECIES: SDR family oxidoreductase [Sphingobium]|uniref:SDR family oxidoreductase n=1 Tax=Sphingobium TaxID=165695 RepID=UPI0020352676|nr:MULTISPECIES: SDR family oxidoreductase [Sphingobium]WBQ19396.1 SDR family oxidoreductase [Sphingobium yanoikuyae]